MFKATVLCIIVLFAGVFAFAADHTTLEVSVDRAPIAPDGTTSGAVTDFVLTFADRNPVVDGIGIKAGGTVQVVLPDDFSNVGGGVDIAIILQGWPQSPRVPFPYATDVAGNTITLTLNDDWMPGAFGPGPKQVHLALFGFRNPRPGMHPISLTIQPDPAVSDVIAGVGHVHIIPKARPSVNVVSLFSGPPGPPPPFFNPLYQTFSEDEFARQVGLYLWAKGSEPFIGVDLEMANPTHGRLVRGRRTVGHVWISPPRGAREFTLNTLGESTETTAFLTGVPVGLLLVQFQHDPNVWGDYTITLSMNNGNTQTMFVSVVDD